MRVGEIDWGGFWEDIKRNAGELFSIDYIKERINRLRNIGVEFDEVYNRLNTYRRITASDPIKYQSYYKLLKTGDEIRLQITKAVASIKNVSDWIMKNTGAQLNDLAAVPLIPIAIAGAILAAILAAEGWIKDAKNEMARLDAIRATIEAAPPEQRAALAQSLLVKQATPGVLQSTGDIIKWVVIGGALLFLLPKFMNKR